MPDSEAEHLARAVRATRQVIEAVVDLRPKPLEEEETSEQRPAGRRPPK